VPESHARDYQPAEPHGAQEIRLYHLHPHTVIGVKHRPKVNIGGGVVYQDLDRTVGLFGGADQRLDLWSLPDVGGYTTSLAAGGAELLGGGFYSIRMSSREHNSRPGSRQGRPYGQPNASGAAGDQSDASGKIEWTN
jgi:hypothetical protein